MDKPLYFDEMREPDGKVRDAYAAIEQVADDDAAGTGGEPAGGSRAVLPPHRHHLQRLRRRAGRRADHPLRHHPARADVDGMAQARPRPRAAREGAERLHQGRLWRPGDRRGGHRARGADPAEPGIPARDDAHPRRPATSTSTSPASTSSASMPTRSMCSRTMPARHPGVSYMLENREATMRLLPDLFGQHRVAAGRQLSRTCCSQRCVRWRRAAASARADRRAADAGPVQLGLLRALVPGRQDGRRAGRGPRPAWCATTSSTCARPRGRSASMSSIAASTMNFSIR